MRNNFLIQKIFIYTYFWLHARGNPTTNVLFLIMFLIRTRGIIEVNRFPAITVLKQPIALNAEGNISRKNAHRDQVNKIIKYQNRL